MKLLKCNLDPIISNKKKRYTLPHVYGCLRLESSYSSKEMSLWKWQHFFRKQPSLVILNDTVPHSKIARWHCLCASVYNAVLLNSSKHAVVQEQKGFTVWWLCPFQLLARMFLAASILTCLALHISFVPFVALTAITLKRKRI